MLFRSGDSIAAEFIRNEYKNHHLKELIPDYFQHYTVPVHVYENSLDADFEKSYPSSSFSDILQILPSAPSVRGTFEIVKSSKKMLGHNSNTSKTKDKFVCVDLSKANKETKEQWKRVVYKNPLEAKGYILLQEKMPPFSPAYGRLPKSHTDRKSVV